MDKDKIETYSMDDVFGEDLKNPEFVSGVEKLHREYQLSQEIIELRKANHLTQKELAKKVGTSQPSIARLESGKYKKASMDLLQRIAEVFNTEVQVHFVKH